MEKYIQIRIKEDTKHGVFNDAIYFTPEEYDALSEEDIQDRIDERIKNYENHIDEESQKESKITEEEQLLGTKQDLEKQLSVVDGRLSEITALDIKPIEELKVE